MNAVTDIDGHAVQNPPRQRLGEKTQHVWRAVAAAGRRGTTLGQLVQRFEGQYDYQPVRDALRALLRGGYIAYRGEKPWGVWIATDRVPAEEQRPAWLDEQPDAEDSAPLKPADPPAPRIAPFSVFTLGVTPYPQPAAPAAAGQAAPEPTRPPPKPYKPRSPQRSVFDAAAEQATAEAAKQSHAGVFALHSTGELQIVFHGTFVRMPPEVTRRFFAWLDRLGGTQLTRVTEEVSS